MILRLYMLVRSILIGVMWSQHQSPSIYVHSYHVYHDLGMNRQALCNVSLLFFMFKFSHYHKNLTDTFVCAIYLGSRSLSHMLHGTMYHHLYLYLYFCVYVTYYISNDSKFFPKRARHGILKKYLANTLKINLLITIF